MFTQLYDTPDRGVRAYYIASTLPVHPFTPEIGNGVYSPRGSGGVSLQRHGTRFINSVIG
ncbi:hypothetical protein [Leptolyngbya sp. FACHB-261]|uniref:hypothetical protein n=1 Tax=Leptolyngbya sp. FACHB-261 TaxID=2692806 RepID=UPI001688E05D|nr:hypothetical protein [Leptolyngbya sp. FACHB-261]